MTEEFWLGFNAALLLEITLVVILRLRMERRMVFLNRAANQRLEMLDRMSEAAGGSVDTYMELASAFEDVDLGEHAEALQRGKTASQIYPPILWGVAKAVEGVG